MACGAPVRSPATPSAPVPSDLGRLLPRQYVERLMSGGAAAERRVVTILFVDVVDSTAMAETLDPEDVMDVMNGAFDVLIQPIIRYEGTVARLMGDGILSFFGAPVAHEDDPERACAAALDMIEIAGEYSQLMAARHGIARFDVRVGVNTGLVVVGEVGSLSRVEYTAMGDAVNVAARLQGAADPGTAFITERTCRAVRHAFEVEARGAIKMRGKSAPVAAYRLVRRTTRALRLSPSSGSSLVGRDRELRLVLDAIESLAEGAGGFFTVSGDPGVGKTRLLAEAREGCNERIKWIVTRCTSYSIDASYGVVREMISALLDLDPTASPETKAGQLSDALAQLPPREDGRDRLRALATMLQLPVPEEASSVRNGDRECLRALVVGATCDLVRARAETTPLIVVLDDLQWADDTSIEVLEEVARAVRESPVLFVASYRRDGRGTQLSERLRATGVRAALDLELDPLDADSAGRLLDAIASGSELPESARETILKCAEGNPFIIEEISRSLFRDDTDGATRARTVDGLRDGGTTLSTMIRSVVMARIDRLSPSQRRLLQSASVIGRHFNQELLAAATGAESSFDEILSELQQRDFIAAVDAASPAIAQSLMTHGSAAGVYAFRHPMTSEVLYESMLSPQRQAIHLRIARAMEQLYPDDRTEIAVVLATHYEQAGDASKAFEYLVDAAAAAADICANTESIRLYRRALDLADATKNVALHAPDVAAVQEKLGDVYVTVGDYRAALAAYDAAEGREEAPSRLAGLCGKKGHVFLRQGQHDVARAHFETGLEMLRQHPDDGASARICAGLGLVYWHRGDAEAAVEMEKLALATMEVLGDDRGVASVCNNLGMMHARNRNWSESRAFHDRALKIADAAGLHYNTASVYNNMGLTAYRRGEFEEAAAFFEKSIERFDRLGNRHGLACALDNASQAYVELDDEARATEYLRRAVAILTEIGMDHSEIVPEMWKSGEW